MSSFGSVRITYIFFSLFAKSHKKEIQEFAITFAVLLSPDYNLMAL